MIKITLILLLLCSTFSEPLQLYYASIDPDTPYGNTFQGSTKGGTLIYITGTGFDPIASGNLVYVGPYPCQIPAQGVLDGTLVCETTDSMSNSNVNNLEIKVMALDQIATVQYPFFSYKTSVTPQLYEVFPSSAIANTYLNFYGVHEVEEQGDGIRDMGDFREMLIGQELCGMFDVVQDTISQNGFSRVKCIQAAIQEAGRYTVTEHVAVGIAENDFYMRKTCLDGSNFQHTVLPAIQSVSPNSGLSGGQDITIEGSGFSNHEDRIEVTVDGVPCTVTSSSIEEIECHLNEKMSNSSLLDTNSGSQTDGYLCGAGFTYERYDISSLNSKTYASFKAALDSGSHSMTLLESGVKPELETTNIYDGSYGQVFKGYFKAVVDGDYIFRGAADDNFGLYISDEYGSKSLSSNPIIYSDSYSSYDDNYYIFNQTTALGSGITLEAGKYYYMELYHINSAGDGFVKISVEVPNSDTSLSWQRHEVNQFTSSFTNDPQIRQFVQEGATGGTFTLYLRRYSDDLELIYENYATLDFNATASDFNSALKSFDIYSSYTVSTTLQVFDQNGQVTTSDQGYRFVWTTEIQQLRSDAHLEEQVQADTNDIQGTMVFSNTQTQQHCPLISGTFMLEIGSTPVPIYDSATNSYSNYNIPYNVPSWTLESALKNLGFTYVDVVRLGTPQYTSTWIINYWGYNNDVPDLIFNTISLEGGKDGTKPTIDFHETRQYSSNLVFNPVDERMMFEACSGPNVQVTVNDVLGVCLNDCEYTFQQTVPETNLQTLTGSTLRLGISNPQSQNYSLSDISVTLDGQECTGLTGTISDFTCQLPTNTDGTPTIRAGSHNAEITIQGEGTVNPQSSLAPIVHNLALNSISPSSGGLNGGYLVTIEGEGFPLDLSDVTITVCGQNPEIYGLTNIQTIILMPECAQGTETITYEYNGLSQTISFTYGTASTAAEITSIDPMSASPVLKDVMTITGSGFGSNISNVEVHLANYSGRPYEMRILSINDSTIECGIPGGLPGEFEVEVNIIGTGNAIPNPETANDFVYELVIERISPTTGSYYGGTLITITGRNFSPTLTENLVFVSDQINWFCDIQSLSTTQIQCRTPQYHSDWSDSAQEVVVTNRLIMDSTCESSCQFTYNDISTSPQISSLSTTVIRSGHSSITITGSNLDQGTVEVVFENQLTSQKSLATVTSSSSTSVTVDTPSLQAGFYQVRVRNDPIGQSNSLSIELKSHITNSLLYGSIKGGNLDIEGKGLPSEWPSSLFSLSMESDSVMLDVQVIETSSTKLCISVPEGYDGKIYNIVIRDPRQVEQEVTFTQRTSQTPQVTLVDIVPTGDKITITLNRTTFSSDNPSSIYYYNTLNPDNMIEVDTWTENSGQLEFNVTDTAGKFSFMLYFDGYGWAMMQEQYTVQPPSAYTAAAVTSSYLGGILTVTGQSISEDAIIRIGGLQGKAISVGEFEATFSIPELITQTVLTTYPEIESTEKAECEAIISDGGSSESYAFDEKYSTVYSSSNAECYIGIDIGEGKLVNINRIRYFPYQLWEIASNYIKGAVIEASVDGSTYTELLTVDQTVHAGWNSFMPSSSSNSYRYIRLRHNEMSMCKVAEFEVYGTIFNDVTVSNIDSYTFTSVTFYDGHNQYDFGSAIEYRRDKTPVVDSVSPCTGDVFGGYDITLTGSFLDIGSASVIIDGLECVVQSSSSSSIVCTVPERTDLPEENCFEVSVGGNKALVKEEFMYVLRWSDIRTWGTDLYPVEGDLVYVPKGMTLFVDQSTPVLEGIVVEEGKLIFADEEDIQIHTNLITINRGQFRAGTEDSPYQHKLTFVMYGEYDGTQQPIFGNKGIGCLQCKFSMHGKEITDTWTMLSATINPGDTSFDVMDSVGWDVGAQIVVASSSFDHNQAEQRTITAISGTTITVSEAFVYEHYAGLQTYGSNNLEMKAEVGLLTRNIKVMGDETSTQDEYGAHIMMAGSAENGMVSHVAYTEFTHCGQPKIVGRYCIHFHMNGDVADSYVKGNAVHHSFARVLTLHAIHFLHVSKNVGYSVKGHNFFIEDGVQTQNVIEYNLAISSLESWNMMQTDISVASFWVTNPLNHLRYNHAAGGDFYAFWYEIKKHPDGPSATSDICPRGNPLGQSHDNVAHSYKRFGLRIFRLASRQKPCQDIRNDALEDPWSENPSIQSKFYNYLTYKIGESGLLAEETGNTIFENFTMAESKLAGMQFYRCNLTRELVQAKDMAIIGVSNGNPPDDVSGTFSSSAGVIAPRTSGWKMSNIRFHNFHSSMVIMQTCSKCDNDLLFTNTGQEYLVEDITYDNVSCPYLVMNGQKRQIIYDLDGTFSSTYDGTSRSSATIVSNFKHLAEQTACVPPTSTSEWDNTLICDNTVKIRKVMFTNAISSNIFQFAPMKVQLLSDIYEVVNETSTDYTQITSSMNSMEPMTDKQNAWALPFVAGRIYNIWWLTGLDFTHLAIEITQFYEDADEAIIFKFNYTETRQLFEIALWNRSDSSYYYTNYSDTLDMSTCSLGDYLHDVNNSMLAICATNRGRLEEFQYLEVNGILCRYLCVNDDEQFEKEDFIRLWSNTSQWPEGRLPTAGENVTVQGPWNLIMDINPQPIGFLQIDGDLFVSQTLTDACIKAQFIFIRAGSLTAGSSSTPFADKFTIEMLGNKSDTTYAIDPELGGNKLIVVSGQLNLYGTIPGTTWTRLASFAHAGDTSFEVVQATDWQVGDEIVIGPSFTTVTQHEKLTITAISGTTVSFTPALSHDHYGSGSITINNDIGTLDTRSAIGHLTRSIKIISGEDSGWGYSLVGYGFNDGSKLRTGKLTLQGVELYEGGQYDSEKTSLKMVNMIGSDENYITGSSIHECKSYCMDISNSKNLFISQNVFYNGRLFHVRALDVTNYQFHENLMITVTERPTLSAKELIACYGSWEQISTSDAVSVQNNVCQGSQLHGFALPYVNCDELQSSPFSGNTVGSARVGWIFKKISGTCMGVNEVKAYACTIGQIAASPSTEETVFQNFMIADSGRGATLRFGKQGDDRTAYLRNSFITAISRPDCTDCYGGSNIDCTSNHALRMLAVTVNGQSLPDKFGGGYDVICKQETFDSKAFLENVIFENYNLQYGELSQCSDNVVFKSHPTAGDMTGSHHLLNTTCNNCSINAYGYFDPPNENDLGWEGGCGKILCTGKNNYLIHDWNGTFLPEPGVLIANNSVIGDNEDGCTFYEQMNGHYCNRQDFHVLEYESIAPDYNTRIMWPVYLNYTGSTYTTETNGWRQWQWQGNQPLNLRLARFVSIVTLSKFYTMTFSSEPPIDMRLQFQRRTYLGDNSEYIIIELKYPRPNSIRVQNQGLTIKPKIIEDDGGQELDTTVCGSNKFFYQDYKVHFVVTGDINCQVRVSLTNSIQLTLRFNMDIDDFYDLDGPTQFIDRMCALLQITDTSRLKIVGIYSGSTIVDAYIDEPSTTDNDNATLNDNDAKRLEMIELNKNLTALSESGEINDDFVGAGFGQITSLTSSVYDHEDDDDDNTTIIDEDNMVALIVGLVLGCSMLVGLIIFGVYKKLMASRKVVAVETFDTTMSEEQKKEKFTEENEKTLGIKQNVSGISVESHVVKIQQ